MDTQIAAPCLTESLCHHRRMPEKEGVHHFQVDAVWSGGAEGSGHVQPATGGAKPIAIAGATVLGGCGGRANPEELLLSALAACFLNTWAIFLKKLQIEYADPAVRASAEVGKDPAGGFHLQGAKVTARVPAALLQTRRAEVEKTLSLTEKYCIISKAVRAGMPLEVVIEEA
jgi:peroxiredoxin-like protein